MFGLSFSFQASIRSIPASLNGRHTGASGRMRDARIQNDTQGQSQGYRTHILVSQRSPFDQQVVRSTESSDHSVCKGCCSAPITYPRLLSLLPSMASRRSTRMWTKSSIQCGNFEDIVGGCEINHINYIGGQRIPTAIPTRPDVHGRIGEPRYCR